jgi:hypothetical protein
MKSNAGPPAALIVCLSLIGTTGGAAAAEKQIVQVSNASPRVVECGVVVDSKLRTFLKIHPARPGPTPTTRAGPCSWSASAR